MAAAMAKMSANEYIAAVTAADGATVLITFTSGQYTSTAQAVQLVSQAVMSAES